MEAKVRLVRVRRWERAAFMRMAERHFRELNPQFRPQADWARGYFESIQENPRYDLRWVHWGRRRVGFALFGLEPHRFLPRTSGMIYELYLLPAFRSRGLGTLCFAEILACLKQKDIRRVQLEVWSGNDRAAAFWCRLGFRGVATRYVLELADGARS
jgi:ribosomal protein S18 acetylase RimI-like enzyme